MRTAEDLLAEKGGKVISVSAQTTVHEAIKLMVLHKIGAVVVTEGDDIVGLWTERDLMRDTITEYFNPKVARVGRSMSAQVPTAASDDTVYQLMDKFLGMRVRHLLIEKDGKRIGLLSIGDVLKAGLQEKSEELETLHGIVSWEYYEEWNWRGSARRTNFEMGARAG